MFSELSTREILFNLRRIEAKKVVLSDSFVQEGGLKKKERLLPFKIFQMSPVGKELNEIEGRDLSKKPLCFVDFEYLKGKGRNSEIYRGYLVEEVKGQFKIDCERPLAVKKISEKDPGQQENPYAETFILKGKYEGKTSKYEVMQDYGPDLFIWLEAGAAYRIKKCLQMQVQVTEGVEKVLAEALEQSMKNCEWNNSCPFPIKKDDAQKKEAFLGLGEEFSTLTIPERIDIFCQIVKQLKAIHDGGDRIPPHVHADLKPENISIKIDLSKPQGQRAKVKILDYELAMPLEGSPIVYLKAPRGTVFSFSPETARRGQKGFYECSKASDIFSLVPILAQLLSVEDTELYAKRSEGERLWNLANDKNKDLSERKRKTLRRKARRLFDKGYDCSSVLPGKLECVRTVVISMLKRMQSKDPKKRPTCDELLQWLEPMKDIANTNSGPAFEAYIEKRCNDLARDISASSKRKHSSNRK